MSHGTCGAALAWPSQEESQPCWNPAGLGECRVISISTCAGVGWGVVGGTEKGNTEYGTFLWLIF